MQAKPSQSIALYSGGRIGINLASEVWRSHISGGEGLIINIIN